MSSVNFVLVNTPTNTARFLTPMIFNKDALAILRTHGLVNVFLDDYGCRKKYKSCLFFLFHVKDDKDFEEFQNKITDFTSFYDYYDVPNNENIMRMFLFKVHHVYHRDLFSFRHERFDEFSKSYLNIVDRNSDFTQVKIDVTQEIYRFHHHLQTIKEDL